VIATQICYQETALVNQHSTGVVVQQYTINFNSILCQKDERLGRRNLHDSQHAVVKLRYRFGKHEHASARAAAPCLSYDNALLIQTLDPVIAMINRPDIAIPVRAAQHFRISELAGSCPKTSTQGSVSA